VAACARPPLSTRNRLGQDNPEVRLARVWAWPCLGGPENLVGPLGAFIGALPDLQAAEQDIIAEQQATRAVFTGFLDRSVRYGVLAHMEMLGLDLAEVSGS